jgi:hypothetical protein
MANQALDDVNAAELQFGKEFDFFNDTMEVLTNDEMMFVMANLKQKDLERDLELSDVFKVTHEYLEKVATTTAQKPLQDVAEKIPALLKELELETKHDRSKKPLHPFERSSLTNLVTATDTTPAEVVHWIPSLSRFDDDEIQRAIDIVAGEKALVAENV